MKITDHRSARALLDREACTISSNTRVTRDGKAATLELFDNPIATFDGRTLTLTPTLWSLTTRARLNAVAYLAKIDWRAYKASHVWHVDTGSTTIVDPSPFTTFKFEVTR